MESVESKIRLISVKFNDKELKRLADLKRLGRRLQLSLKNTLNTGNSEKCGHEEKKTDRRLKVETELIKLHPQMVEKSDKI